MSRTPPWVFWHRFGLLPTLGNQNLHRGRVGPASAPLLSAAEGTRGGAAAAGQRWGWGHAGLRGAQGVPSSQCSSPQHGAERRGGRLGVMALMRVIQTRN